MSKPPTLKPLHSEGAIIESKLELFRKFRTEELIHSLRPDQAGCLKARPDGTMIDGHHRIAVLRGTRRGYRFAPARDHREGIMLPVTYQIEGPWPGQLAIIARPRGGEWLEGELHALKEANFDVVLSLLTSEESEELGLAKEAQLSAKQGLEFLSFPIPDLGVPASAAATREFLNRLLNALRAGKRIAIHCRQGIGRSGLIATSLLVMEAIDPFAAFRRVSAARNLEVPETAEQRDWVMELSHHIPELAGT